MTRRKPRAQRVPIGIPTDRPCIDGPGEHELILAARDIHGADPGDPHNCGHSRCAKRTLPGVVDACTTISRMFLIYTDRTERYALPESMSREAIVLDRSGRMAPGVYRIRPVPPSTRYGVKRTGRQRGKGGQTRPTATPHHTAWVRRIH